MPVSTGCALSGTTVPRCGVLLPPTMAVRSESIVSFHIRRDCQEDRGFKTKRRYCQCCGAVFLRLAVGCQWAVSPCMWPGLKCTGCSSFEWSRYQMPALSNVLIHNHVNHVIVFLQLASDDPRVAGPGPVATWCGVSGQGRYADFSAVCRYPQQSFNSHWKACRC
jgi:hypothetical protein